MVEREDDIIIRTVIRLIVPLIQMMALYVYAHGHISPGGGFQGGCMLAASFILLSVALGLREAKARFNEKLYSVFIGLGVFIYAFTGAISLPLGGEFLNYGYLSRIFPFDKVMSRYYGIALIELGVQITVTAAMLSIFYELVTSGMHEKMWEKKNDGADSL